MKNLVLFITCCATFLLSCLSINAQSEFSKNTISIGVVVKDLEVSVKFYTEIIGMKETGGFSITESVGKRLGLSNGVAFDVKVLKLENDPNATEWKLMSFSNKVKHKKSKFIQDDRGMQYTTIFVNKLNPFIERIKANKIKLLGETPTQLDNGQYFVLIQDPDGTFIELIGPMK